MQDINCPWNDEDDEDDVMDYIYTIEMNAEGSIEKVEKESPKQLEFDFISIDEYEESK